MLGPGLIGISTAGALLLAASVASGTASNEYDHTIHCGAKTVHNAQLLKRNREAVVFRKHRTSPSGRKVSVAYACLRDADPIRRLKRSEFTRSELDPRLAGHFVAFREIVEQSEVGGEQSIAVLNIKTGRLKVEQDAAVNGADDSWLYSFVVKRNGSVAWVGLREQGDEVLLKVDSKTAGQPQQLDSGSDFHLHVLRLNKDKTRVVWIKRGNKHSAPLY
jgi:hypothetical protein